MDTERMKFYKISFWITFALLIFSISYIFYESNEQEELMQTKSAEVTNGFSPKDSIQLLYNEALSRLDSVISSNSLIRTGFGECKPRNAFGTSLPPNHVLAQVTVTGKNIKVEKFLLNRLDYSSSPGCFTSNPDGTNKMDNVIPFNGLDSLISFSLDIRTMGVTNNPFEFSIIVKDDKGSTLAKFPNEGQSLKGKIQFLKYPVTITDVLDLKKVKRSA